MKHNITHRKLNRTTSHRKALLMNLSNSLIKHEQITTTLAKAKELRRFVEKIVTLGKKGDLLSRRKAISILQDQKMSKKVFDVLAQRYKERAGGYTRIIKLGNRFGDNSPTAVIELVDRDENAKGLDSGPVIEKKSTDEEVEQQPQI
jgi:large subunit ribosomal protein L17